MSKLTQKELISEGFLDTIRRAGAKALGGVVGGVVGAAKQVAKDVLAADTSASIFNVAKQGSKGMASGYKAEAQRQLASDPKLFVEDTLKSNYSNIFDPASIKIIKQQEAAPASHKSFRLSTVNKFFVYFEANKYNEPSRSSNNQTVQTTKIKGIATVVRGNDRKFKLLEIKDENGNLITVVNDKKGVVNYDRTIAPFINRISNPNSPLLRDYATVIQRAFSLKESELKQISGNNTVRSVVDALKIITGKQPTDTLDQNDIDKIKDVFRNNLIAEKSQINLLKQLILLNDSYNRKYELSKY